MRLIKGWLLHDLAQGSGGTWLDGGTIVTAGTHQPVPSEQNTISKYKPTKIKNIKYWFLCWTLFIISFLLITPLCVVNCPHKLFKTDCLLMTVNWVLWSYRMSSLEQIDQMLLGELLLLPLPLPHLLPLLLLHHQPSCFLQLKKLLKVWWMTLDHRCLSLCLKQRCWYQLEEKQAIVFFNVQSCAKFQWVSCL